MLVYICSWSALPTSNRLETVNHDINVFKTFVYGSWLTWCPPWDASPPDGVVQFKITGHMSFTYDELYELCLLR